MVCVNGGFLDDIIWEKSSLEWLILLVDMKLFEFVAGLANNELVFVCKTGKRLLKVRLFAVFIS